MTAVTAPGRTVSIPTAVQPLAGVLTLLRFDLRRERVSMAVWIAALLASNLMIAASFAELYREPEEVAGMVLTLSTPAGIAMTGPRHYLTDYTFGAMMSHEMLGFVGILVALMSILIVVRHTRTEEETGRAELLRSNVVGRHAQLAAALITAVIANLLLGIALAFGLAAMRIESIDLAGGLVYGAAHAAIGIAFAGIAAITVQITPHARGAIGMGLAVVGLAYALRAAGDVSESEALSWLTPIGWAQRSFPYLDNRWWPLVLCLGLAMITAAAGFALSTRRDVGAGLRQSRPGRATASRLLGTPIGQAIRLHRAMLIGFAVGVFLIGTMYGSILGDAESMLSTVPQLQQAMQGVSGRTIVESFASIVMVIQALICSAYLVIAGLRPRAEERAGRAEPVLATGLSRTGWLAAHGLVTAIGGVLLLISTGLGIGLTAAASVGDQDLAWRLPLASLAYAPALWVVLGLTMALYGWLPRWAGLAWVLVVYGFVVSYLGTILQFPDWVQGLSPFGRTPALPAEEMSWPPLLVMTGIAAVLIMVGLIGFRRRDLDLK